MVDAPKNIEDPLALFETFTKDTTWWGSRTEHLQTLPNGFEKWLATEWLLWIGADQKLDRARIGTEYKATLESADTGEHSREQKQIDLWWAVDDPTKGPWNYVELKVVFNNANRKKVFTSAGWDLSYLSRLARSERPHFRAIVVVGSGFIDESPWNEGVTWVTEASGRIVEPGLGGTLGTLRWQGWSLPPER
ncbi:MAG: hypothetical protein OHK0013_28790 [Sandaracinaceae bacterium]